jgi:glycosyltransferase involved in cell wall biosynthesis
MCSGAAAVTYVARAMSHRYPAGAWWTACSDIALDDEAFANAAMVAARGACMRERRDGDAPWRLVFVGSLAQRYKGPDVLIEAVARCRAAGLPLELTIVGDGRHRAALAAESAARGVAHAVRFTGQLAAGGAVRDVVDGADLFVLPSRTEGLPRALLEAMARGVPGLGTRVGGIPELLPMERLVEPGDAAALAAALQRVLADPGALAAAGARDHAIAREYHVTCLRRR